MEQAFAGPPLLEEESKWLWPKDKTRPTFYGPYSSVQSALDAVQLFVGNRPPQLHLLARKQSAEIARLRGKLGTYQEIANHRAVQCGLACLPLKEYTQDCLLGALYAACGVGAKFAICTVGNQRVYVAQYSSAHASMIVPDDVAERVMEETVANHRLHVTNPFLEGVKAEIRKDFGFDSPSKLQLQKITEALDGVMFIRPSP
jgi:hypothetical protein